jgi:hypothetical protein
MPHLRGGQAPFLNLSNPFFTHALTARFPLLRSTNAPPKGVSDPFLNLSDPFLDQCTDGAIPSPGISEDWGEPLS